MVGLKPYVPTAAFPMINIFLAKPVDKPVSWNRFSGEWKKHLDVATQPARYSNKSSIELQPTDLK